MLMAHPRWPIRVMVLDRSLFHSTSWISSYDSSASCGGAATAPAATATPQVTHGTMTRLRLHHVATADAELEFQMKHCEGSTRVCDGVRAILAPEQRFCKCFDPLATRDQAFLQQSTDMFLANMTCAVRTDKQGHSRLRTCSGCHGDHSPLRCTSRCSLRSAVRADAARHMAPDMQETLALQRQAAQGSGRADSGRGLVRERRRQLREGHDGAPPHAAVSASCVGLRHRETRPRNFCITAVVT